ncbi:MAG: ArsR/SmtB family transcription factor [Anaerolineae bacterium]
MIDRPESRWDNATTAERVAVEDALLDETTAERLAETFKALSDPTRVRLIAALAAGEVCVHDLASLLEMSQSAISHQLATLREMNIVTYTREGRQVYYRLDDDHVRDLFHQALEHTQHTHR